MRRELPVAVTGMGAVCALGTSVQSAAKALFGEPPRLTPSLALSEDALPYPFRAVPDEVWGREGRRLSAADTMRLGLLAAREALAEALWPSLDQTAVVAGTTSGSALHFLEGYRTRRENAPSRRDCEDYLQCNPALVLSGQLGTRGPRLTVSNACTSGADAIGVGVDLIRSGAVQKALCGGMDALSLVPHTGFARLMLCDEGPCRPFDARRRGLNLGEGAAFLCLESLGHALSRGARVLGFVLGCGSRSDAYHFTSPHPEGAGLSRAVADAMAQAGATPEDLAFVNVHGTATPENDRVEGRTLARILPGVPLWASKGLTGHTLGAAGALEAVFTLLALRAGRVPASAGFAEEDPEIGVSPTIAPLGLTQKTALSTSLGFGGGNAALVLSVEHPHD